MTSQLQEPKLDRDEAISQLTYMDRSCAVLIDVANMMSRLIESGISKSGSWSVAIQRPPTCIMDDSMLMYNGSLQTL